MNKIKEIIRKIESKKETFEKIALLKELDDEVSKFRKELINKYHIKYSSKKRLLFQRVYEPNW